MNDGQLLVLIWNWLSSRNWSTRGRIGRDVTALCSREGEFSLDGTISSAKGFSFSECKSGLKIEYESDEECQLSDHQ